MSKQRSISPRVQENEIHLDSDSQSDSEHSDDSSGDYAPSDLRRIESEEDSKRSDDSVNLFTDQFQPSTSRRGGGIVVEGGGVSREEEQE